MKKPSLLFFLLILSFSELVLHNTVVASNEVEPVLINGDFELGDLTGWTTGTGSAEALVRIITSQSGTFYVHSGTYGLALVSYDKETMEYSDAWIEQELISFVEVEENTILTFWAKFYSNHKIKIVVSYKDGLSSIHEFSQSYGEWHEYVVSNLLLNKEISKIHIERIGGGNTGSTTAIDDISFSTRITSNTTSTLQPNSMSEALMNGDFEHGDLTGWKTGNGSAEAHVRIITSQSGAFYVHSGTYGLALISYDKETMDYSDSWIEQNLDKTGTVDELTQLTFWGKFYYNHVVRITATYSDLTTSIHNFSTSSGDWYKYSVTNLLKGKVITAIRIERIGGGNTKSTTAIDDISLLITTKATTQTPSLTPGFTIFQIFFCFLLIGIYYRKFSLLN